MIYWLCEECSMGLIYDDFSSVDHYFGPEGAGRRVEEIKECMAKLPDIYALFGDESDPGVKDGDGDKCACCHWESHGNMHRFTDMED